MTRMNNFISSSGYTTTHSTPYHFLSSLHFNVFLSQFRSITVCLSVCLKIIQIIISLPLFVTHPLLFSSTLLSSPLRSATLLSSNLLSSNLLSSKLISSYLIFLHSPRLLTFTFLHLPVSTTEANLSSSPSSSPMKGATRLSSSISPLWKEGGLMNENINI